jgi:glycosyltransferase involved in cell wall biosynthesis
MADAAASAATATAPAAGGSRLRLLKVVTVFACGGTERQFVNLGLGLDPRRFDLEFACLRQEGQLLEEIARRRLTVNEYPMRTFYSARAIRQQLRLARYVRRHDIQIVHAYNFHANVFAVPPAYLAGAPVVLASIRDQSTHLTERQVRVQAQVCRLADRVLVNADAVKSSLCDRGFEPDRIVVIRNGLDMQRFSRTPDPRVRQELGIPPGAPIVALVSRLDPIKGVEHLLDAAGPVLARHPEARFLIVGEGPVGRPGERLPQGDYAGELAERARRLGLTDRVVFTGYRPDVPDVLAHVQVAVLPSLSEGLSNFVLEAMATGVPVVATRVGGNPELVRDADTGLLVPPADAAALTAAIDHLLDAPDVAAAMGQAGRRRIQERFSLDRMIGTTEALYQQLLAEKRACSSWRRRLDRVRRPFQPIPGDRT